MNKEPRRVRVTLHITNEDFTMVFAAAQTVESTFSEIEEMVQVVTGKPISIQFLRGQHGVLMKGALVGELLQNDDKLTILE